SYDRWFRAEVQEALDDPSPGIPHDEAMAMLDQMLEEIRRKRRAAA
ncbi:stability determinant, partial [Pseudomonas sp. P2758]